MLITQLNLATGLIHLCADSGYRYVMQGYKKSHEVCTDHATSDSHFLIGRNFSVCFVLFCFKKTKMGTRFQKGVPGADSDTEISHQQV